MKKRVWLYSSLTMVGMVITTILFLWLWQWGQQVSENWEKLQQDSKISNKEKFELALESTKVIVGVLGTVATIAGGIVLYLNFRVANRNAINAESRLITERFSNAVDQLGNNKIEVRLGGIYALEWIAQKYPSDHWTFWGDNHGKKP